MTYISAQVTENRRSVIVWERDERGDRDFREFRAPYYFYYPSEDGNYTDIHGKKLAKLEFSNSKEFQEAKEEFANNKIGLYESDIGPEYKILSKHYFNKPIGKLNVSFLDIEVDKDPSIGYATIDNPYAPIISIAIYHQYNNRFVIYAVPPDNSWTPDKIPQHIHDLAEVVLCKDEKQLLRCFLAEIDNTDILSGWNSEWFDMPYIYFRLLNEMGIEYARQLSFPNAKPPRVKEVEKFNVLHKMVQLYGRISLDYLDLFKKLEQEMRPSYKLEAIAEELLPDLPKLEYEGSLNDLYRRDFLFFLRYNIRDTEILKGFEKKLKYVEFAVNFSHLATGMVENVLGTIKLTDTTFINICHYVLDKRVPDVKKDVVDTGKFAGALVLDPQTGMQEQGSAVDVISLYPSTIRALNISPEKIVGQFVERYKAYEALAAETSEALTLIHENGVTETHTPVEWKQIFKQKNWAVSGYGTVLDQNEQGFIPAILTEWFNKRKEYKAELKKLSKQREKLEKGTPEYEELTGQIDYFDKMQYVMKIRLNSIYGCLGNPYFRFYDVRNAESTTRSGREILMHMVRQIANLVDGEYTFPSRSIIYGDTDSCYFKTHGETLEECIAVASAVTDSVNASFPSFLTKAFNCGDNFNKLIAAEWEFIFDRGIFVNKKLYVLHLVYNGGKNVDKMKIMGLQLKKTTIPKPISKRLIKFVEQLLKGQDWNEIGKEIVAYKDDLYNTSDILQIGLPKGIKGIEDYTDRLSTDGETNLPGHVAASIFYNQCLKEYGDRNSEKISSGFKIKVFYLNKPFGRFKSIALPTDTKKVPDWFMEHFFNLVDREAQITRLVDDPLESIIDAIGKIIPTKKSLLVDELVEY